MSANGESLLEKTRTLRLDVAHDHQLVQSRWEAVEALLEDGRQQTRERRRFIERRALRAFGLAEGLTALVAGLLALRSLGDLTAAGKTISSGGAAIAAIALVFANVVGRALLMILAQDRYPDARATFAGLLYRLTSGRFGDEDAGRERQQG